ncbi:MAG: hypothetical protein KDJ38_02055, partial [Gammaproteobacteria bacterium]|nr:hypothetical protein [Gammaproteobacteria bacterium]
EEDVESIFLDAGAVVSIKSNGQNYLELQRVDLSQDISFYATGGSDKTPPIPSGLTVTIPGAQFPAFTDVPFIDVGGFALTAPGQGSAIRFDTVFTWQPIDTNNPNIIVEISASSFNTTVSCVTSDSGSFAFPEETQNELGTGFFANELSASRIGYHVRFKDDAALVVYSLSQ